MSPRDLNEMEELDGIAAELTEAGHVARLATIHRERPEPGFSVRLRAELMRELPSQRTAAVAALPTEAGTGTPTPPARPMEMANRSVERRQGNRPFIGPDRHPAATESAEELDVISGVAMEEASQPRSAKRWAATAGPDSLGLAAAAGPGHDAEEVGKITALKPHMRWHIPTRVMPSRWIAVGLAASVAAGAVFYGSGLLFTNNHTVDTAADASAASLVRGSSVAVLSAGAELQQGDEIKVGATGRATLQLGHTYVRMDGGSDVKLVTLDPDHTIVSQIAGRVYHRALAPSGGDYSVVTASVTWKADGTALDLDRQLTGGGGEQVSGMALFNAVAISGPQIDATLNQGNTAVIVLTPDGTAASPIIAATTEEALLDDWLVANAGLDERLGLPLGQLAEVLSPAPTEAATATPTAVIMTPPTEVPTATPTPAPTQAPTAAPTPTPTPTSRPTPMPTPTPRPTPTPTPSGYLGTLSIVHNSDGTYTFTWPKYTGSNFNYYKVMHADYPQVPNYGNVGDYWACPSSVTDNSWTGTIDPGDYNVRIQVLDDKSAVRSQTNVVRLTVAPPATVDLGNLTITNNHDGTYKFDWTAYLGFPIAYYKLVFEPLASGKDPSYPDGSSYWAYPGASDTSVTLTVGVGDFTPDPGTYKVRIQAIAYPLGPAYAYGQTAVATVTIS
jgi:hypothetical protein